MHKLLAAAFGLLFTFSAFAQTELTIDDIWKNGTYRQKSVYGLRSMNDGAHYTVLESDRGGQSIVKYAYSTGEKVESILAESTLKDISKNSDINIGDYQFSADESKVLIAYDEESIYRHSSKARYYVIDLKANKATQIARGEQVRNGVFSPDGQMLSYISDNNIFIQNLKTQQTTQVTNDGEYNNIINGFADWVYEEEFAFDQAYFWSPDSKMIAFYKSDESKVKKFHMPLFNGLYPEDYSFKYPKAGEDNSKVTIHLYTLEGSKTQKLELGDYEYIPRIKWTQSADYLAVMRMPRLQNELFIDVVKTVDLTVRNIYKESSDTYIEISDDLTFYGDNAGFIWRSEKDGFFHLYSYGFNGNGEQQLTKGNWEVKEFIGYSPKSKQLFFSANITSPINTGIYSIPLKGGKPKALSPEAGNANTTFSSTFDYFILYHNTANSPVNVTLHSSDGKLLRTLEENQELNEKLEELKLPKVEFFDFTTSEEMTLNGWMIKPKNFDSKKKYPVLMFVYGGPGSQMVTNAFSGNYWWHQLLAQKGYMVVCVDNRGTGARGKAFRTQTYGQLGKYETMDQIEAAKWLGAQTYVDKSRIGIWGWSYGGYMSSLCLYKGADVFKTAIAVAPVSNWRFYDSIYTERYMGLPQDNAAGYDDNSPINHVEKLQGNYLLVHGTADDNVHFQNSVELVEALNKADKQYDFAMYPDKNHGIYGGNTRHHLFTRLTNYIEKNL
jgi:dipeptidyl-peptidase 4